MTRSFIPLPEGTGITDLERGGTVAAVSDEVYSPELLGTTDTGVAFGPILLETPPGGAVPLESLTFLPGEGDSGGFLAITAAAGTTTAGASKADVEVDLPDVSRRGVLTFLVAAIAAAALIDTAAAEEDELITLNVAKFVMDEPTAPVTVSVVDAVAEVLPPTTDILIDQEGSRVGEIVDEGEGVTLRQTEGEVRIYIRDELGRLAQLLAWARSFLPEDASLSYRRPFPDGAVASDYEEGEFVRLSSHPAIVDPIDASDQDRTVMTIGDETVPHADDGGNDIGSWSLLDGALIYEVGPEPPEVEEWEVTTRLSAWQSIKRRYL